MTITTQTQDRIDAINWAQRIIADPDVLYLDTETTGLLKPGQEIIELSLVDQHGNAVLDTLIRPRIAIPAGATRVHGITNEMVADAPTWPEVYEAFCDLVEVRQIVIYNVEFDLPFIHQMNCLYDIDGAPQPEVWWCAMLQYSAYAGVPGLYGDYNWHKLDDAHKAFSDVQVSSHRAADDARACRIVVQGMAAAGVDAEAA